MRCSGDSGLGPETHSMGGSSGSGVAPSFGFGKSSKRRERTLSREKFLIGREFGGSGIRL
jgi:hypothetical protein